MFGDIKILLNTYDPDVVEAQKAFIRALGPYRILATAEEKEAFWKRVENYWFVRWPLKSSNFVDTNFMAHRQGRIIMVFSPPSRQGQITNPWLKKIRELVLWSATFAGTASPGEKETGWRGYLAICEAKQGIARVRLGG